jgi:acyl carrier protein phosphodiesterase
VYSLLKRNEDILPLRTRNMLTHMIQYNWLKGYAPLEGINRALTGMSRRAKFESKMDEATGFLKKDYQLYETEFDKFFPELKKYADKFLEKINN